MPRAISGAGARLLLALPCLASCLLSPGSAADVSIPELQGKWVLQSINDRAIPSEPVIFFKIEGMTISGFDGCNSFGGPLDAPDELRITQRACPSDGPRLPLQLSNPRAQLESSRLDGDTLELDAGDEGGTAKFQRQPPERSSE